MYRRHSRNSKAKKIKEYEKAQKQTSEIIGTLNKTKLKQRSL
jgi:hypothetical protein